MIRYPHVIVKLSKHKKSNVEIIGQVMVALRRAKVRNVDLIDFYCAAMDADKDQLIDMCSGWVTIRTDRSLPENLRLLGNKALMRSEP